MNYNIIRNVFIIFAFLVLIAFLILMDPVKIFTVLYTVNLNILLVIFIVASCAIFLRTLKWYVLVNNVSFKEILPIQLIGITISNFTPGRIAEPVKTVLLKIKKNIPVSESLQSVIFERIIDIIVLIFLSLIGMFVFSINSITTISIISIGAFTLITVFLILILYKKEFGYKIYNIFRKLPIIRKFSSSFIENFYNKKVDKINLFKCFIVSLVVWILEGVILYLCLVSLGIYISPIITIGIVALAILIGNVSFLPGGIGSTEIAMTILLTLSGVVISNAVAATVLFRLFTFWYVVFLGVIFFIKDFSNEKSLFKYI